MATRKIHNMSDAEVKRLLGVPAGLAEAASEPDRIDNPIDHPNYYMADIGLECVAAVRAKIGRAGFEAHCVANVDQYLWRAGRKTEDSVVDTRKAAWWLNLLAELRAMSDEDELIYWRQKILGDAS
jgi:hypothetical protein